MLKFEKTRVVSEAGVFEDGKDGIKTTIVHTQIGYPILEIHREDGTFSVIHGKPFEIQGTFVEVPDEEPEVKQEDVSVETTDATKIPTEE